MSPRRRIDLPTTRGTGGDGAGRSAPCRTNRITLDADRRSLGQATKDAKGRVHPASTCLRLDPADLQLVRILAADPDAEDESPRRSLGDRGELTGNRNRVTQRSRYRAT